MMSIREYLENILNTQGYDAWEQEDEYMYSLLEQDQDKEIEEGVEGHVFEDYCVSKGVNLTAPHPTLPGEELHCWCMDHWE